jgi:hypothetical protein
MTKEPETRIGMTKELAPHIGIMINELAAMLDFLLLRPCSFT